MCRFLEGLKWEIREIVTRRCPNTFAEATDMAIKEEQSSKLLGRSHSVNALTSDGQEEDSDPLSRSLQSLIRKMEITDRNVARLQEPLAERDKQEQDARGQ